MSDSELQKHPYSQVHSYSESHPRFPASLECSGGKAGIPAIRAFPALLMASVHNVLSPLPPVPSLTYTPSFRKPFLVPSGIIATPGGMSHEAQHSSALFVSVSAPKTDSVFGGGTGVGWGLRRETGTYLSPVPRWYRKHSGCPKYLPKEQPALYRAQSVTLWQSYQPGLQGRFPVAAPKIQAEV